MMLRIKMFPPDGSCCYLEQCPLAAVVDEAEFTAMVIDAVAAGIKWMDPAVDSVMDGPFFGIKCAKGWFYFELIGQKGSNYVVKRRQGGCSQKL